MKHFENAVNFGLGLISYSAEKIEGLVNELVKRGEVASEDAKKLAKELMEKGETQREVIKTFIQEEVSKMKETLKCEEEESLTKDEIRQIIREELENWNNADTTEE